MSACTEAGCGGVYAPDGYCDVCGTKQVASHAHPPPASSPIDATPPKPIPGAACNVGGCDGRIATDGYCDTCGTKATTRQAAPPTGAAVGVSIAAPSAPATSSRVSGASRRSDSQRTGSTRTRLGAGLVTVVSTEVGDPALAVMSAKKIESVLGEVPEDERFCSSCGRAVGRSIEDGEGRIKGFCSHCRTPFDFQTNAPALAEGDLVGGQYEILGPLAHGGMGWIYLGRDQAVSNRWVVLKGLLNENDPDAALAAVAERQFLAQIEHANIVNIYNFVTHLGRGYIVMEFVGGESLNKKLKDRRAGNNGVPNPLPVTDAISYILGVMPAFGYLHALGLVYNDLKPANIMAVGGDVKLIDVGAVMQMTDQQAAIFGTQGFQAPEVAAMGPSVSSDLYTVGRTLAVLILDFVFHAGAHLYEIPPPHSGGLLAQWESLHRLLLKATAAHPDDRFQTSAELQGQLTGVLREIVAVTDRAPRPAPSNAFSGDRLTALLVDQADVVVTRADWRALPIPKTNPADPAAAFLEDLVDAAPATVLSLVQTALADGQATDSQELRLARARALLESGDDPAEPLAAVAAADAWDWRVEWYRSVRLLSQGEAAAAAEGFSRVWTELPGELAPRLAAALAAESAGEFARAASLYERVISVDSTYVSAAFGLARCRAASGDTPGAVAAYRRVPASSATYQDAQVASARALITPRHEAAPHPDALMEAAQTVDRLQLDAVERARLSAEILEQALAANEAGTLPATNGIELLGHPLDDRGLRLGLERAYRELARLEVDPAEKVRLVDRANGVRPRSLL